jgi:hypothetical protein
MTKSTPGYDDRRNRVRYRHVMCEKPVKRKPRIRAMIKDAEKDGKKVSGATVAADGSVTLQFGEADKTMNEADDEFARWKQKKNAH